jgi:hypothetical protein
MVANMGEEVPLRSSRAPCSAADGLAGLARALIESISCGFPTDAKGGSIMMRHGLLVSIVGAMTGCAIAQQDDGSAAKVSAASADETRTKAAAMLSPAERAAGWTILFDGSSTDHWRGYRAETFPEQGWSIDDHALHVIAGGGGGDIITREQYGDFELALEWKVAPGANSGIMYRVTEEHGAPWMTGPEYQVLDDVGVGLAPDHPHAAGAIYDLHRPAADKMLMPAGRYNTARIRLSNGLLAHWLNGMKVLECDVSGEGWRERIANSKFRGYDGFGMRERGHIALQDHGNDVWFRTIRIRDLDEPMPGEVRLFNGRDLTGWEAFLAGDAEMDDVWSVEDGVLVCTGRPAGYIKTKQAYDNFVLKLEWRWDPETKQGGNSGVLLRQTGEDRVWPRSVEAQLMSGSAGDFWNIGDVPMKTDPDRTSGRNTKKRRAAERPPGEWNSYEIIVDHDRITLYINGELVNRAWDVEEMAGPICLQSEGAEIHFRNIRLAPIGNSTD